MKNPKSDPDVMAFFDPDVVQVYSSDAPVSAWAIRAWCRAMGDRNPVYRDPDAARRYGHQDVFAPPAMMYSFTFPDWSEESENTTLNRLRRKLTALGLGPAVSAQLDQEYITPLRIGDRLRRELRFESISDEKRTAVGAGHFILMLDTIFNQNGDIVGRQRSVTLFYRAGSAEAQTQAPRPPKPAAEAPRADGWIALPPLAIPLTTTGIVAGSLASNDFEKIHHDRDVAQRHGMKDIFMNILTSTGLVARYVTDWAGPAAAIKGHSSRFMAQNFPGDTMTLSGWADRPFERGRETKVHVRGTNSIGINIDSVLTIA